MDEKKAPYSSTGRIALLVLVCFFLSGLTGLIYEILWTRMIVKIIGTAPFAVSIVLTVFMAGLGLGSYIASRTIDRIKDHLKLVRIYGILELIVGGYCLVLPFLLKGFLPIYAVVYNHLFKHFMLYNLLTFVGCSILLIIPVTCMGATLPVLCRFYVSRLSHLGTHAGRLYGLNTIGAAGGALLCGFWLINLFGVYGTLALAVILNAAIGLVSITASYKWKIPITSQTTVPLAETISEQLDKPAYKGATTAALIIFAVSGFCAMAYEVIWTKLLGLIIGPTTYSFTIVLVTFITVLALGSMVFGWLADRVKSPINLLVYTQILAGLFALFVSHILGNSQFFFAKLIYHFQDNFALLHILKAGTLFLFMFFPTFCLGATFPLVGKIYTRSLSKVGGSIGFAYTINTIGAVLGSFCAGFLLIPFLGKENGLRLVTGVQMLTALVLAAYLLLANRQNKLTLVPIGALVVLGAVLCVHFPRWDRHVLARGKYQRFDEMVAEPQSYGWLKALLRGSEVLAKLEPGEVLYYGDGISGFTTVLKYTGPLGNTEYSLSISGKMDASSRGDMKTQTLSAHFPMIFHRNPKTVMVLGLASGISAGETLYYPIEKLDVLEISPEVVAASRFFNSWNNNVLSDPRTELIVQDGLAHLQLTNRRYDIIISEPSNPWMAGIAALFTREFFVLARERLNVDGIFCQWLHSYQMDWPTFALVGRTFAQVFPNSLLFSTNPSLVGNDYLLVGFKGEGKLSLADTEGKLPFIRQLKNATLTDPKLLYRQIASQDLQELFGPGPVNTAIRPSLEFAAPKLMYQSDPNILIGIRSRKRLTPETADVVRQVTTDVDAQIEFAAFALSLYCPFPNMVDLSAATPAQKERFYKLMERYCADNPVDYSILRDEELAHRCRLVQIKAIEGRVGDISDTDTLGLSYFYLADLYSREGMFEQCINYYSKYLKIKPDSEVACHNIAQAMAAQGKYNEALVFYRDAVRLKPDFAEAYLGIAMALSMEGKVDESVTYFNEALRIRPDFVEARTFLGTALLEQGKLDQAIAQFTIALEADPNLAEVHANLGAALTNQGKFNEAIRHYREALRIKPDFAEAHSNLGMALAIQGKLDEAIIHFTQAIKIKPELPDVHYNLGLALSRQQRVDEAIAQFEEVLRLDPQYKGARQALDTLLQLRKTRSAK